MMSRAFSRHDATLKEAPQAVSFHDMLANAASLERNTVVIVPTAAHRRAALVTLARNVRGRALPEVCTLATYARQMMQLQSTPSVNDLRVLSTADAALVLRYAARSTGQRLGSLDFSIERLLRWKNEGITPLDLQEKAEDEFAPRFVRVLDRFARVWTAYELIKGPKGADRVDVMVHASAQSDTPNSDCVIVWQPHALTQVERAFVRAIGEQSSVAIVWAPTSDTSMVRERTSDIISWGWGQDEDASASDLARLTHMTVHAESTRIDEVRRILLTIKTAVSSGEVSARDVCIITPGSKEYRRQLVERAQRAGIPIAVDPQRSVHTTGVALALRAACDVVSGGWRRADLERLLRSGFVFADDVAVGALLRAASAHRILGGNGPDEWSGQLRHRRDVLHRVLDSDVDSVDVKRMLVEIDNALQVLGWLRTVLARSETQMSSTTFAQMITTMLQQLGIARTATDLEKTAKAANLPCAEREALVAVEALTERYAGVSHEFGLPTLLTSEHIREWWEVVRATQVRTPDVRIDGIPIITPEEARGRTWKLVLAPGFIEGEFPQRDTDPLESEILPDAAMRRQRAAFEDILHAVSADGSLVITHPKEVDNAEALPSSFIQVLAQQASNSVSESNRASSKPGGSFVLDPFELSAHHGRGLPDAKGRQRAALPSASEDALHLVNGIVAAPISASRLEKVVACPYQFFAHRILQLNAVSESQDSLSGLERGAMMHDIARRFYERVRGSAVRDITSLDELLNARVQLEAIHKDDYLGILRELYNDVSKLYDTDHTYAETERRSLLGTLDRPGLLYRWLANELTQQASTALRPALFEFDVNVVVNGEAVRARVDRIDVAPFETPTALQGVEFAVIDYKTTKNSAPSKKKVVAGDALQMPLYVAAVGAAFEARGIEATPSAAIYRTFGRSMKSIVEPADHKVLDHPSSELMNELSEVITENIGKMRASSYPVAPSPGACERCSYIDVCRVASWGTVRQ